MGLEVETVEEKDRRKAVARYVAVPDGDWEEWLQTHRTELNAMTTPQLIEWLDRKMETFRQADPAGRGAGGGTGGTNRKESSRRNHRAHPARRM